MTNGRQAPPLAASTSSTTAWTVHDASELYEVPRWSNGYFSVNGQGHVQVHPTKDPQRAIDLKELIDRLQLRGISLPVLVRFTDILKHRLGDIHHFGLTIQPAAGAAYPASGVYGTQSCFPLPDVERINNPTIAAGS